MKTIVVSNAGVHPEPMWLAKELRAQGRDVRYYTTLNWTSESRVATVARGNTKGHLEGVRGLLRRRILPTGFPSGVLHLRGSLLEVLRQMLLAFRSTRSMQAQALVIRDRYFEWRVASSIGANVNVVVAQHGNSLRILERATKLGVPTVLNCPAVHWASIPCRTPEGPAEIDERAGRRLNRETDLASVILVASEYSASTYVSAGVDPARIRVIPLGVALQDLGDIQGCRERPASDRRTILYVGRLTWLKGADLLVEAFHRQGKLNDCELKMVGATPESEIVEAATNVGARVLGQRPRWELRQILEDASILVMPTRTDGFGLAALEAMAVGTPVVVSDNSFGHDLIRDGINGFVFKSGDVESLVGALERALGMPIHELSKMGQRAAVTASGLTWAEYARRASSVVDSFDLDGRASGSLQRGAP